MKSLLISSLALGVSLANNGASYFIGPYSANGVTIPLAYPLNECVSTGAPGGKMAVFGCYNNTGNVWEHIYSGSDCSSTTYTTMNYSTVNSTMGNIGYANCWGYENYMILDQYINSCDNWASGTNGDAVTTLATGACVVYNVTKFGTLYSRTDCTGDGYVMSIYIDDSTCSDWNYYLQNITVPLGCYPSRKQGGLQIYSAMRECVWYGEELRCTHPLVTYTAGVLLVNLDAQYNWQEAFEDLFPYATVNVVNWTQMDSGHITEQLYVTLSFCSQYEDAVAATSLSNLGQTLWDYGFSNADAICWACLSFDCTDPALCGSDSYCSINTTMCLNATTTAQPTSSAAGIYVSFLALVTLVLSLSLF